MRSSQRSIIDPFIVMDIMERAEAVEQKGQSVVHMEVGQPGTSAPKAAKEFLKWTRAGGRVLPGLVRRRKDESILYQS